MIIQLYKYMLIHEYLINIVSLGNVINYFILLNLFSHKIANTFSFYSVRSQSGYIVEKIIILCAGQNFSQKNHESLWFMVKAARRRTASHVF